MAKNAKELICKKLLTHVQKRGIANISTVELAKEVGIVESVIFYHFKTVRNLIDECAINYDRELTEYSIKIINEGKSFYELWDILFDYVLKNPEGANFYFSYVNYYGFDPTETNTRAKEFLQSSKKLFTEKPNLDDHTILILWDFITTQLFYYCDKITKGYMDNNKKNKALIKKIVFSVYDSL